MGGSGYLYEGSNREARGVIEHDCLNDDCLTSWDRFDHQYDTECIKCGSTNIVHREGFDLDITDFFHDGKDYRRDYNQDVTPHSLCFDGNPLRELDDNNKQAWEYG